VPAQADMIRASLDGIPLLGTLPYSRSVQEADLRRSPVMQADAALVQELDEARRRLVDLAMSVKV
jgi:CO dehydrogenase nickel-insertion accessory protein CooC1